MANKHMIFAVPEKFSLQGLGELLSDKLMTRIEQVDGRRIYLDTFDWRLYRSGVVLELECGSGPCLLICRELNSGRVVFSRMIRKPPVSAADFSSVGSQAMLKDVIGRRSLIAHVTLNVRTSNLLILNRDEKSVMRVELRRDQIISPQSSGHIILDDVLYFFPYRGYESEFKDRLRWAKRDGKLAPITQDPMLSSLEALNIVPGQYTSRPVFSIERDQPGLQVLIQILRTFLQIMESNIAGARDDSDPEYLHDFLVAVRRTTIFLHSFASLYPANNLEAIEHGFQWIEQEATPIRDLDIYMSLFDDFETRVDADHRKALSSLYQFLQEQKKKELRQMRVSLNSPRYFKLLESWSDFLRVCETTKQLPKDAAAPIGKLACDRINTLFYDFIKKSPKRLNDVSVTQICELHQVSKHLGYHLDVFASMFPKKNIGKLLKAHAKLQSSLNQFRDMNLQYSRLREYKSGMKKAQAVRKVSLEAVDQLITDRKREKTEAHKKVMKQVKRFTRKKMRKRFDALSAVLHEGDSA